MTRESRGRRVLVVDDDAMVLQLVAVMLKQAGFDVETAQGGIDALAFIRNHHAQIDLLLTDVVMPDMDGVELVINAREVAPRLPILFMTGYADVEAPGPTIAKPFKQADLLEAIQRVVQQTRRAPRREEKDRGTPGAARSA